MPGQVEYIRIGLDPTPGEEGAKRFRAAAQSAADGADLLSVAEQQVADAVREGNLALVEGRTSLADYVTGMQLAHEMAGQLGASAGPELNQLLSETTQAMVHAQTEGRDLADVLREMGVASAEAGSGVGAVQQSAEGVEDLGEKGKRSALGVGRLNNALTSMLRQVTGVSPVMSQAANAIGSLALSGVVMTGALAGLAAIAYAWRQISRDAREAKERQEEAANFLKSLADRREDADLGPSGVIERETVLAEQRLARVTVLIGRLSAVQAALRVSSLIPLPDVLSPVANKIRDLQEEMEELTRGVAAGAEQIRENLATAIREGIEERVSTRQRFIEEVAAEMERAAEQSREVVANLRSAVADQRTLLGGAGSESGARDASAQVAREQALRAALANTIASQRDEVTTLVNTYHDLLDATADANRAAEEEAELRERLGAERDEAREIYESTALAIRLETDELRRLLIAEREGEDAVNRLSIAIAGERAARELGIGASDDERASISAGAREREKAVQAIDAERAARERLQDALEAAKRKAEGASEDSADAFKNNWITAINAVGAGLGGLGQDIASLGVGFLSGGWAGVAAAGAGVFSRLMGGGGPTDAERHQEQMVDAQRRAIEANTEAVKRLTDAVEGEQALTNAEVAALLADIAAGTPLMRARGDAGEIAAEGGSARPMELTEFFDRATDAAAKLGITLVDEFGRVVPGALEKLKEALGPYLEGLERERDAMEVNFQVQLLRAQGMDEEADAMQRGIDRQAALNEAYALGAVATDSVITAINTFFDQLEINADVAIAAAEALRIFNQEMISQSIEQRNLRRSGDNLGADIVGFGIQRDQELQRANESGFDPEIIAAWTAAIWDDYNAAVAAAIQSTQDLANAIALKDIQDIRNLDLEILRLEGRQQEALDLEQLIRLEAAMHEGRSQEILDRLAQIDQLQDQALAAQMAQQAQRSVTAAVRETTNEMNRMVTALNAPQGFNLAGVRSSVIAAPSSITIQGDIVIQTTPGESGDSILRRIREAANREAGGGGSGYVGAN